MKLNYKGFNEQVLTFKAETDIAIGTLVKITKSDTVAPCVSGDKVIGVVTGKNGNDLVSVQVGGYAEISYASTAPSFGYNAIAANSSKAVKVDATNGVMLKVISIDTTSKIAGIIL